MGELVTASASADPPAACSTEADKSVGVPSNSASPKIDMTNAGAGLAVFSTNFGARPPRAVEGPPPPVIVRSDPIKGVVEAAWQWQNKYLKECLCIFPHCGWKITDLWDAADIHIDTPKFCAQVLYFLSNDTLRHAIAFSKKWAPNHPEAMRTIEARDLTEVLDPNHPFAVVDAIFVDGEMDHYPREFLWHIANMLRLEMIKAREAEKLSKATNGNTCATSDPFPESSRVSSGTTMTKDDGPAVVKGQSAIVASNVPLVADGPSATVARGRKPAPTGPAAAPRNSSSVVPQATSGQPGPFYPSRVPSFVPTPGTYPVYPTGQLRGGYTVNSPTMSQPILHNPKGRGRRSGSGSYNQQMPSGAWSENMSRVPSVGTYPSRQPSGAMSAMPSPYFAHPQLVMAQPNMGNPYGMHGYTQVPPPMSPSVHPAHPYQYGMLPPGMSVPMGPAYAQQPFDNRDPRTMYNMTNNGHHANMLPQGPYGSTNRRNSSYGGGGMLYDPYDGTNPAFNDPNVGRRSTRQMEPSRPRKASAPGNRPAQNNHGYNRPETGASYNGRYASLGSGSRYMQEDLSITQNGTTGCGTDWIAPMNTTVNELFIGDLPVDVENDVIEHELADLFQGTFHISPVKIWVRPSPTGRSNHAFVMFHSIEETRKALELRDYSPKIGGKPISVTVPWKFFRKPDPRSSDHGNHHETRKMDVNQQAHVSPPRTRSPLEEATVSEVQDPRPMYSPQDARSDLPKKDSRESEQSNPASTGSPEAAKSSMRTGSTTDKLAVRREDAIKEDIADEETAMSAGTLGMEEVSNAGLGETIDSSRKLISYQPMLTAAASAGPEAEAEFDDISTPLMNPEPMVGDESVLVKDATAEGPLQPLVLESPQVNHKRIESQSKATLETMSVVATAHPVVNLPTQTVKNLSSTQQIPVRKSDGLDGQTSLEDAKNVPSTLADAPAAVFATTVEKRVTDTEKPANVEAKSQSPDEVVSDEDVEASFQSAQEIAEIESTSCPQTAPASGKKGAEQSTVVVDSEPTIAPSLQGPAAAPGPVGNHSLPDSALDKHQPVGRMTATSSVADDVQDAAGSSVGTATPTACSADLDARSTQSITEVVKKNGPQQTPSLNPFAKPSKAQRQKEKELKKKRERKEQEEKAGKAKAGNANSSTVAKAPTAHSTIDKQPQASGALRSHKDSMKAGQDQLGTADRMPIQRKALAGDETVEGKEANDGKQTGGTTTIFSDKTGSITHKAKLAQTTTTGLTMAGSSIVSSHLSVGRSHEAGQSAGEPPSPANAPLSPVNATDVSVPPKDEKPVRAIPNLILPDDPSTSTKIRDSHSTTAPPVSSPSTAAPTTFPRSIIQEMSALASKLIAAPTGSEATAPSSSSTADNFHTPMQTPVDSTAPPNQAADPKKKKSRKKKKPATTEATGGSSRVDASTVHVDPNTPFGSLMADIKEVCNIVREAKKKARQDNKDASGTDNKDTSAEEVDEESHYYGQIQAFCIESGLADRQNRGVGI